MRKRRDIVEGLACHKTQRCEAWRHPVAAQRPRRWAENASKKSRPAACTIWFLLAYIYCQFCICPACARTVRFSAAKAVILHRCRVHGGKFILRCHVHSGRPRVCRAIAGSSATEQRKPPAYADTVLRAAAPCRAHAELSAASVDICVTAQPAPAPSGTEQLKLPAYADTALRAAAPMYVLPSPSASAKKVMQSSQQHPLTVLWLPGLRQQRLLQSNGRRWHTQIPCAWRRLHRILCPSPNFCAKKLIQSSQQHPLAVLRLPSLRHHRVLQSNASR